MSRLQRVVKTSAILLKTLTRLAQQLRQKTTSEHVVGLRGGGAAANVPFKSQNQVAKETKSHMDFLPVPEGSWEEYYQARNNKFTKMIVFSTAVLGLTVYCMYMMDCFFMHDLPSRRKLRPDSEVTGKILPSDQM